MALIKVTLDVPEVDGIEDWLEDAVNMFGRTLGEGSKTKGIELIVPYSTLCSHKNPNGCDYTGWCTWKIEGKCTNEDRSCAFLNRGGEDEEMSV